jgi:type I restriction-modification system DNA methylase subunit
MTHSQITAFHWSVADLIRDTFNRGKYQDVILPLTVLRRIDQVLEPTKEKVLTAYSEYKRKLNNPDDLLRKASGYAFYNTSLYTFERLVDDPQNIAHSLLFDSTLAVDRHAGRRFDYMIANPQSEESVEVGQEGSRATLPTDPPNHFASAPRINALLR